MDAFIENQGKLWEFGVKEKRSDKKFFAFQKNLYQGSFLTFLIIL